MTTEEAVEFCLVHNLSIEYYAQAKSWHVYPAMGQLAEGATLVECVRSILARFTDAQLEVYLVQCKREHIDGYVCPCCSDDQRECGCSVGEKWDRNENVSGHYCGTHQRGIG